MPVKMLKVMSYGIPKFAKKLAIPVKISKFDKMEMITENKTTNPPMDRMVEIDFLIASPKISPRLETRISSLLSDLKFLKVMSTLSFFQKRKTRPTQSEARIWLINKVLPRATLPKRETPTEPKIKIGPELLVKAIRRSASDLEQILLSYRLHTTLAPTG